MFVNAVVDFLRDAIDKILITVGGVLLWAALLFVGASPLDQLVFAVCLFLGAGLMVVGFVRLLDLLPLYMRSKQGLAVILVTVSVFLLITTPTFLVVGSCIANVLRRPAVGQGIWRWGDAFSSRVPAGLVVDVAHPNAWLLMPVIVVAICLLATGLFLRLHDEYF